MMDNKPENAVNSGAHSESGTPDMAAALINDFYNVSESNLDDGETDVQPIPRRRALRINSASTARYVYRVASEAANVDETAPEPETRASRAGLQELFDEAQSVARNVSSEFAGEVSESGFADDGETEAVADAGDVQYVDAGIEYGSVVSADGQDEEYLDMHSATAVAEPKRTKQRKPVKAKASHSLFTFGSSKASKSSKASSKKNAKKTAKKAPRAKKETALADDAILYEDVAAQSILDYDDNVEQTGDAVYGGFMGGPAAETSWAEHGANDIVAENTSTHARGYAGDREPLNIDRAALALNVDADASVPDANYVSAVSGGDNGADEAVTGMNSDAAAQTSGGDTFSPDGEGGVSAESAASTEADLTVLGKRRKISSSEKLRNGSRKKSGRGASGAKSRKSATEKIADDLKLSLNAVDGTDIDSETARTSSARPGKRVKARNSSRHGKAPRFQGKRVSNQKRPNWAAPVCVVCALLLCGMTYLGASQAIEYGNYRSKVSVVSQDRFHAGTQFEGYSLEGFTLDEATYAANELVKTTAENANITIIAGDETFTIGDDDIGLSTNTVNMLSTAYTKYRTGSLEERYQKVQNLKDTGENLVLDRNWNETTLRNRIQEIADAIYVEGKNAGVAEFNVSSGKGSFEFSKEQTGIELDVADLYQKVTAAVADGNLNASITAVLDVVEPKYDIEYMKENFGLIASASTNTTSNSNRNKNIKLAASTFNGKVIMPGETFSFNESTGQRTARKGYREAGAYSGGVTVQELGGGVCQVSTTLYQAVCKADLEIVDRSPHSRPSSYTGIGLDAAVSWPGQDFQFRNDTDFPIYLAANYYDRTITVRVYGHKLADGMSIKLTSEKTATLSAGSRVERRRDSSLARGETKTESARNGYRAVSYKVYYDSDGDRIKSVKLDDSYYAPSNEIVRYN